MNRLISNAAALIAGLLLFATMVLADNTYDQQRLLALIQQYMAMQQSAAAAGAAAQNAEQQLAQKRLAQQITEMSQAARAQGFNASAAAAQSLPNLPQAAGTQPGTTVPAKRPGITRIGLVLPRIAFGAQVPGDTMADPVRQSIASYLRGPSLETVPILARLPAQVTSEAEQSGVDYILQVSLTRKEHKKGGLFGGLASKAAPALVMIPGGGVIAQQVKGAAAQTAATASVLMTSSIQDKDELTLEYQLVSPDGKTVKLANSMSKKAAAAGEDLLSPLIEQTAVAIGNALAH